MSNKGRVPLEDRIGRERFKQLLEQNPDVADISALVCEHEIETEKKKKCEACRRAIYRAKERIERETRADKTFQPIDTFADIPEIARFREYQKAKGVNWLEHEARLHRMWTWIKESGRPDLTEAQRPIMWKNEHIQFIRIKVDEQHFAKYGYIQSLRQFFNSCKRYEMLKDPMLSARRRDMRSPNGAKREIDRFRIDEFLKEIIPMLNANEAFAVKMHVTIKSREGDRGKGSLLGLRWSDIDFNDNYYGFETVTARVYEPKTSGGTTWEHCPINFWFGNLGEELKNRQKWAQMSPVEGSEFVIPYTYDEYRTIWAKISATLNKKFEPHDCRRSPSGWLRDLKLSDLAIGQYDARTGKAVGFSGVGWENAEIFYQRYGKMNPTGIFNPEKRALPPEINGLVLKALEGIEKTAKP